jgi:hypothetical protein
MCAGDASCVVLMLLLPACLPQATFTSYFNNNVDSRKVRCCAVPSTRCFVLPLFIRRRVHIFAAFRFSPHGHHCLMET